jgi:CheY-like chemotaxis protein
VITWEIAQLRYRQRLVTKPACAEDVLQRAKTRGRVQSVSVAGPKVVSVFCTDDHAGFRSALRSIIDATPGFVLVGEACSAEEAIDVMPAVRPDLVLMDVHMPGMGGIRAATILARNADVLVVLMSVEPPELPPWPAHGHRPRVIVNKSELSSRKLGDLWHRHRPPQAARQGIFEDDGLG